MEYTKIFRIHSLKQNVTAFLAFALSLATICCNDGQTFILRSGSNDAISVQSISSPVPVPTIATLPFIKVQGETPLYALPGFSHSPGSFIDLDTGSMDRVDTADIEFSLDQGSDIFYTLVPLNHAKAHLVGQTEPGFRGCQETLHLLTHGNIPDMTPGDYLCLLTNEGNLSQLRIEEIGLSYIEISFVSWGKPIR